MAVDCGLDEISVGGISATEQIAGYNVFELSADGIASINTRDVAILKYPSLNYDARGTATYTGSPIIPGIGYRPIIDLVYLSATPLSGMTEIKAADIAECETSAILSTASGTTEYNLFPVFCSDLADTNLIWTVQDGKFVNGTNPNIVSSVVPVAANAKFDARTPAALTVAAAISCDYNIGFDSRDGFSAKFGLQVS